jgi:hypothetical protein
LHPERGQDGQHYPLTDNSIDVCRFGIIFVDAVTSYQRIQKQQPRPQPAGRLQESHPVQTAIEPKNWCSDHVDLEPSQIKTAMPCHSVDAVAHDRQCVFNKID